MDGGAPFGSHQRWPVGELTLITGPSTRGTRFGLKSVGTARARIRPFLTRPSALS